MGDCTNPQHRGLEDQLGCTGPDAGRMPKAAQPKNPDDPAVKVLHVMPSDVLVFTGLKEGFAVDQDQLDYMTERLGVKAVMMIEGPADINVIRETVHEAESQD